MTNFFRIHGDNIVECERIVKLIIKETNPINIKSSLLSPSTLIYTLQFEYYGYYFSWQLELLAGFNKAGRVRWENNIFTSLQNNGCFLEETPDAIITYVKNGVEVILFAIEFCSALQAGNQAWQRSGRAFSTGRTGCPYLYIVDFVKYELDSKTRKRKALRFPNPAVPYSYINFSKKCGNFIAQIYVKSEEFNKYFDPTLKDFDENNFADTELSRYIVKRMCGFDTSNEEKIIIQKNFNIVMFLAKISKTTNNFTPAQWRYLYVNKQNLINFSLENSKFSFHKTITAKGQHGKSLDFLQIVDKFSVGLASRDLPFGIIPSANRNVFASELHKLYPTYDIEVLNKIGSSNLDLILCIIKGFKPRGDDNRPDRGVLPLVTMLTSKEIEVMTYIYGPILERNLEILLKEPMKLAKSNGFWKSILALSNYVALDVPIISENYFNAELLLDTSILKTYYIDQTTCNKNLTLNQFSSIPLSFHEDDVDTGIHFLFSHILNKVCFDGMCNPPGGDWSGLSVLYKNREFRWLSLPRISKAINGKRPDHVLELFEVFNFPVLLSIESKERSNDLEHNVGQGLVNYIRNLMSYIPSVERVINPYPDSWQISEHLVNFNAFKTISAAAYLKRSAQVNNVVFDKSKCDMLFIMEPIEHGWQIEIATNNQLSKIMKNFICSKVYESGFKDIIIF